jgi:Tfp pilus assembly protein PilX
LTRKRIHHDEGGFAIVIAVALTMLIAIVAVALTSLVMGEDSNTRRDQAQDSSYQAAEAGTNAYLTDLTESTGAFYTAYMAKGEATRTDSNNATHANNCSAVDSSGKSTCSDATWNSVSWGSTWTYPTPRASDTGWFSMGDGYQYLIQVYPPSLTLSNGLAQVITRIDVTGRPTGSTDLTRWREIETMLRPSSLADFQAFSATDLSYGATATTTGPIFVGENSSKVPGNLSHAGTAKANLYAEGTVTVTGTLSGGAKKYDMHTTPSALCKLNDCTPVPFSSFQNYFTTALGAANAAGLYLGPTDPTPNGGSKCSGTPCLPAGGNSALSGQSPAYGVDAWKLVFQSNGTILVSSCKKYTSATLDYDTANAPICGNQKTLNVPSNGVIYSATDVLVSGVVKGKVTVASAANVIWAGQTTYNQNGVDVLGVMATDTIYVAQWAPRTSNNLTIYGAEFALSGPFEQDPNYCTASGTLNYYGSTAIYGINGTTVCGQSLSSSIVFSSMFSVRNYNYDNDLLFVQPPIWPSLGQAFTILLQRQLS